jgi:hypothetical protein
MGLDMYANAATRAVLKNPDAAVDLRFVNPEKAEYAALAYWRKFNALHDWMEARYKARGGEDQSFNCSTLRLTGEDLDALERELNAGTLEPVPGFFFGRQEIHPADVEETRIFITKARAALAAGLVVFYDSWW